MDKKENETVDCAVNQVGESQADAEPLTDLPVAIDQAEQTKGGPGNTYSGVTTVNDGAVRIR